jgi:hypothetical protein
MRYPRKSRVVNNIKKDLEKQMLIQGDSVFLTAVDNPFEQIISSNRPEKRKVELKSKK